MTDPAVLDAPPAAPPTGPLADLILARLLPAKKSLAPAKLRADLAPLFRDPPPADEFGDALAALRAAGLVAPRGQVLTDAGRARALAFLGVERVPGRGDWAAIKTKCLLPKALGQTPPTNTKGLAALLLKQKLGLPVGTGRTLTAVFEAIAGRELGFPDAVSLKSLIPTVLGRVVKADTPLVAKDVEEIVPRTLLGLTGRGAHALRDTALADWLAGHSDPAPVAPTAGDADEPFDLEAFAATVRSVARDCPTGRFGGNKVFISHVWRQLRDEPRFAALGADGFKAKLVDANRANLLTLSRADLVQLMDPTDVRESETTFLTAVYHFISVEVSQ
ncbi:hypothetical protein J0H58_22920 [bacterium]|nr:hypothetical protein [bacterium]